MDRLAGNATAARLSPENEALGEAVPVQAIVSWKGEEVSDDSQRGHDRAV